MKVKMRLLSVSLCVLIGYAIYLVGTNKVDEVEQTVHTCNTEAVAETVKHIEIEQPKKNKWDIELTDNEIDILAKILFLEAHCEPEDGMLAVIEVIFNRMTNDEFPNTLEEVLSQSNPVQFTSWKNIELAEPTVKEYRLIIAALNGEQEVLTNDYVYFGRSKQNNNDPILIGKHWFCKC